MTPAQRATGRFFFVHKAEARLHDDRTRSYEFLHATFGEFLVARLTVSALRDLAALREVMRRGATASGQLDDGFLHAVLSFSCLAASAQIIVFLDEQLQRVPDEERIQCRAMLAELIAGSLFPHPSRSFQEYEPERHSVPRRLAIYSANLVVLLVLIANEVSAADSVALRASLTPGRSTAICGVRRSRQWNGTGLLTPYERGSVARIGLINVRLAREDGTPVSPSDSLVLTEEFEPSLQTSSCI